MKCSRCGLEIHRDDEWIAVGEKVAHLQPTTCVGLLKQQVHDLQATTIQVADFGGKAAVDLTGRIAALEAENATLHEDKARLDWLLENVEGDRETERIAAWLWDIAANLCPVDYGEAHDTQKWGRKAIDAARKEAPDAKD